MNKTLRGVIHGKTIELVEEIEVTLQAKRLLGTPPGWSPGCTETAGGMMANDWTEEDDRILEEIYQDRKRSSSRELPE